MQILKSSMIGDRPSCHVDKEHKVYRHGTYERNGDNDDKNSELVNVDRFHCVPCGRTIGVLPDDCLPYRAVPAPLVEKHFDAKANGTAEPAATEKEKGCLKRAWTCFNRRIDPLMAVLGQMISRVKPNRRAKRTHCAKVGIPNEKRKHRTKQELALELTAQAIENGAQFSWVLADAAMGTI
jgi:hypothetical protein